MEDEDELKNIPGLLWLVVGSLTELIPSAAVWRAAANAAGGGFSTPSCSPVDHRRLRRGLSGRIRDGSRSNVTVEDYFILLCLVVMVPPVFHLSG